MYVCSPLVQRAPKRSVTRPASVTLGGRVKKLCLIEGEIEGLDFFADAVMESMPTAKSWMYVIIGALTISTRPQDRGLGSGGVEAAGIHRIPFWN